MNAGQLRAWLEQIPDDTDIFIDIDNTENELAQITYNEHYCYLTLFPGDEAYDGPTDDDEEPSEDFQEGSKSPTDITPPPDRERISEGSTCSIPEKQAPGVVDL